MTIQQICESFKIGGHYVGCREVTTGIINDTFLIDYIRDGIDKHYILQKINKDVFKNPDKVMENIVKVTDYVRVNIIKKELSTKRFVLRVFNGLDGRPFVVDNNGDYWRCYRYVVDSYTIDSTEDLNIIKNIGTAFGRFQNCLDGFDANSLYISIPNFHNTIKRYEFLKESIKNDPRNRVQYVKKEIDYLLSIEEEVCRLQKLADSGEIPIRVTHNDTKSNNVCLDKTSGEALAVLDLDTVMPGLVAHDFGDAVRFIANKTKEDDANLSKVGVDLEKYKAFAQGFVSEVKNNLTDLEKQTLNLGVFTMTAELATRFLADYINGDVYFKVKYPGHNLDRARNQIALCKDLYAKKDELEEILKDICK